MNLECTVVFDSPSWRNLFMKKLTRGRVVPIISASVSLIYTGNYRFRPAFFPTLAKISRHAPGASRCY